MTPEMLLEQLGVVADAPDGVKRLRELILQLAVGGRLVPQDPRDEPASMLLERIQVERRVRSEHGKTRGPMELPHPRVYEAPEVLPTGWCWTRLVDICEVNPRNELPGDSITSFCPMALLPDTFGGIVGYEEKPWEQIKKGFTHFAENDVVIAKITPCFQNGKAAVMRGLRGRAGAGTTELVVLRPVNEDILPDYVLIFVRSPGFVLGGIREMTGTAGQQRVSKKYFTETPFPLPPAAEQQRIVAKVRELMADCDELGAQQKGRMRKRDRLNRASLHRLASTVDAQEMNEQWSRIRDNFDLLYDSPDTVTELRQAILQAAVCGRLVRQDPTDEPASVLLSKIEAENASSCPEAKMAKRRVPEPVAEAPSQPPAGWQWTTLAAVLTDGPRNGLSPKPADYPTKTRTLTLSATTSGTFDPSAFKYVDVEVDPDSHLWLRPGDVLLQRGNTPEYVGIAAVYYGEPNAFIYPDLMIKLRASRLINLRYLHYAINSRNSRDYMRRHASGTSGSMPKVSQRTVLGLPLLLPPDLEQDRIVAKLDQLMEMCDQLEKRLIDARLVAARLASSVVQRASAA